LKRLILQLIQALAVSVFIAISVYGIWLYLGGERQMQIPVWKSLIMGLIALACIVVIVVLGGLIDKLVSLEEKKE
jgi:hypothetical protein